MSYEQDPNEQADISGADLAIMVDEIKALQEQLSASQAREAKLLYAIKIIDMLCVPMSAQQVECWPTLKEAAILPSDDAALRELLKQARLDGLKDAVAEWEKPYGLTDGTSFIERLRRMANNQGQ